MCVRLSLIAALLLFTIISCRTNKLHNPGQYRIHVDKFCNLVNTNSALDCIEYLDQSTSAEVIMTQEGMLIKAMLFDTDIQAEYTERDAPLYKESCFEIFFDPKADGVDYYEIQINAFGTIFDYQLRDAIGPLNTEENMVQWHIPESRLNINIDGTINNSSDKDKFWSFDVLIPWSLIEEGLPKDGDCWAFNFMRVEADNDDKPTYWVWKPTGKKLIHVPETWPQICF